MRQMKYFVMMVAVGVPVGARGSSIAPMYEGRCSQTSLAALSRMAGHEESGTAMLADALHLFPHLEVGMAPIARQFIIAAKPSITTCFFEFHLTAEVDVGFAPVGNVEGKKEYARQRMFADAAWRVGIEGFFRPTRWLSERWRFFDAVALGFGVLGGDVFSTDIALLVEEKEIEFGPRLLFDVNEWLAFIVAMNAGIKPSIHPDPEPMKLSAIGSVQLSFPSHLVFGDSHASH